LTRREAGYAAIRDYAAFGDGRTAALVARDGSIDWLCLPSLDSGSVFGALLDAERGGAFQLAPAEQAEVERRYLPDTNLLETTFTTATGSVRVTDAMPLPLSGLAPTRELVRRIEGLSGEVPLRWRVEPRFDYGRARTRIGSRAGIPVAGAGSDAIAVLAFDAGEPESSAGAIEGGVTLQTGTEALLALSVSHGDPLVLSPRAEIERRIEQTGSFWRDWATARRYTGRGATRCCAAPWP
jgi:GH15 family glucan-1,4-alpha-glucosidase